MTHWCPSLFMFALAACGGVSPADGAGEASDTSDTAGATAQPALTMTGAPTGTSGTASATGPSATSVAATGATTGADATTGSSDTTTTPRVVCGDGLVEGDEVCDDGHVGDDDDACTDECRLPVCGDGIMQASRGETCDLGPGNRDDGDCTAACELAACGDGLVHESVEECDDGDQDDLDACSSLCARTCPGCPLMLMVSGGWWLKWTPEFEWVQVSEPPGSGGDFAALTITGDRVGVAAWRGYKTTELFYAVFQNGTWGPRVAYGADLSDSLPSLAAGGKGAHLAFQELLTGEFRYAAFDGMKFGPAESIGVTSDALGNVTDLDGAPIYVFTDAAQGLDLAATLRAPVWQPAQLVGPGHGFAAQTRLVGLDAGAELFLLHREFFSVRKAGVWSAQGVLDGLAAKGPPALAALPGGRVFVTWWGADDDLIHYAEYAVDSDTWTAPAVLPADFFPSHCPPAVAPGVAPADVELAYVQSFSIYNEPVHARRIAGKWIGGAIATPGGTYTISLASAP